MIRALRNLIASEPTLLSSAVRSSLLAGIGFGLEWSTEAIAALMIAVEAWLAVLQRALVTPESEVRKRENVAASAGHVEGYRQAEDDVRSITPRKATK